MEYRKRNHIEQGNYYTRHVRAMTAEKLHSKSDIAGELAHRDMEIDRLKRLIGLAVYRLSRPLPEVRQGNFSDMMGELRGAI